MADTMEGEELVRYIESHSTTERALTSSDHINKLLELAGETQRVPEGWYNFYYHTAKRYIEKARENLRKGKTHGPDHLHLVR